MPTASISTIYHSSQGFQIQFNPRLLKHLLLNTQAYIYVTSLLTKHCSHAMALLQYSWVS